MFDIMYLYQDEPHYQSEANHDELVPNTLYPNAHTECAKSSEKIRPGNRTFLEVASMVVTRWLVGFFAQCELLLQNVISFTFTCV